MGFSADPYRPLFSVWRHYPGSVLSETELVCPILTHKGAQSTLFYRLTQSGHYPLIIAQIVNGIEAGLREAIEQGRLGAFVRQYRADQLRLAED